MRRAATDDLTTCALASPVCNCMIDCRHIFGLRGDVKDNIHFFEESTIVYPVGHTVVSYNVETKVQRFTPGSPESEGITALAVSPNKKFLAVAERADKGTISVYDLQTLKRRKVLVSSETGAKVGRDQCQFTCSWGQHSPQKLRGQMRQTPVGTRLAHGYLQASPRLLLDSCKASLDTHGVHACWSLGGSSGTAVI